MNDSQEIREYLNEYSPEAILCLWNDCDSALLGTARIKREDQWNIVAMYSYELLVMYFMNNFRGLYESKEESITDNELESLAIEHVDFNIHGAYVGPFTPLIIYN